MTEAEKIKKLCEIIKRQKAEIKKLQEAEAKRIQETAAPLVIRNNKIPAQELAKMIKIGVISTDIEGADIYLMDKKLLIDFAEKLKQRASLGEFPWDDLTVTTDQIDDLVKEMVGDEQ